MNEQQLLALARKQLDASAERLPFRVTHRLERARREALGQLPVAERQRVVVSQGAALTFDANTPPRWTRAASWLSLIVLVGGLYAISAWSDARLAEETAEIDLAMLTDDGVPIAGYADRGFGVFLKNTRQ